MNWRLSEYLEENGITPYQLFKETGLSVNTIYPIARNEARRVDRDTLGRGAHGAQDLNRQADGHRRHSEVRAVSGYMCSLLLYPLEYQEEG